MNAKKQSYLKHQKLFTYVKKIINFTILKHLYLLKKINILEKSVNSIARYITT